MAYTTLSEATTYFTDTLNQKAWELIEVAQQSLLLESASRYIDDAFTYSGTQIDETKAFPRTDLVNKCNKNEYAIDEIPQAVKNATAEIALEMNSNKDVSSSELNSDDFNIIEEQVSSLKVKYKSDSSSSKSAKPYGFTWLKCLLSSTGGIASQRIVKG